MVFETHFICVSKSANKPGPAAFRRHDPSSTSMLFQCGGMYVLKALSGPLQGRGNMRLKLGCRLL